MCKLATHPVVSFELLCLMIRAILDNQASFKATEAKGGCTVDFSVNCSPSLKKSLMNLRKMLPCKTVPMVCAKQDSTPDCPSTEECHR